MNRTILKKLMNPILCLLLLALVVRVYSEAVRDSWDFLVYWRSVRAWMWGTASPYLVFPTDNGFVFKYPPWTIPLFVPFVIYPELAAKIVWCAWSLLGLGLSQYWLKLNGVSLQVSCLATIFFWRLWISHFNAGQINLILLPIILFAVSPFKNGKKEKQSLWIPFVVLSYTSKIFSAVSLLGIFPKLIRKKTLFLTLLLFSSCTFLVYFVMRFHGFEVSLISLFKEWMNASSSGGAQLGESIVRSAYNTGFPALFMKIFRVKSTDFWADIATSVGLSILLSGIWFWVSKSLSESVRWTGWIALGVVIHPLAWQHSYVLAYPLFAFALSFALSSRKFLDLLWVGIGYLCIDMHYPSFLGEAREQIASLIENASIKSWGVVLLAAYLVKFRDSEIRTPEPESKP